MSSLRESVFITIKFLRTEQLNEEDVMTFTTKGVKGQLTVTVTSWCMQQKHFLSVTHFQNLETGEDNRLWRYFQFCEDVCETFTLKILQQHPYLRNCGPPEAHQFSWYWVSSDCGTQAQGRNCSFCFVLFCFRVFHGHKHSRSTKLPVGVRESFFSLPCLIKKA